MGIRQRVESLLLNTMVRIKPVQQNKVFGCSYQGRGYGDNTRAVLDEVLKKCKNVDVVIALNEDHFNDEVPSGVRKVRYGTYEHFYEMGTAKVWIDNMRILYGPDKRKGQVYFQLWHAPIMLKKVENDAAYLSDYYIAMAKRDSRMADYLVSGSGWLTEVYRNGFWYDGEILESGTPRLDRIINGSFTEAEKRKVLTAINVDPSKKIVMYAPTFRNNDSDVYNMDYTKVLDALEKKFGGEWVMLLRFHPNVAEKYKDFGKDNDRIINVTRYPDLYELIPVIDVLITDYSSTMFEFAVAGKTVFIYAADLEHYSQEERGLYFRIEELPYSVAENTEEMIENISSFNISEYQKKVKDFFDNRLQMKEYGNSSAVVADMIKNIIGE